MAARLCSWICKPCEWLGKGCDHMCNACGRCCTECTKGCSHCCASCCEACQPLCTCLGECCEQPCILLADFCSRPFSGTLVIALLMNICPFVIGLAFGMMAITDNDCGKIGIWMIVQALLGFGHMFMAGYVFRAMQQPFDETSPKDRNMNARIHHMLCDDAGFAIYLLLAIFQFVWLVLGAVWSNDVDDDDSCPDRVLLMAEVVMILTWIYIVLAVAIFLFSWCCSCCSEGLSHANSTFGPTFFGFFLGQESEQRRRSRQQQRHYRSAQREAPAATVTAVPVSQARGGAYGGGVRTSGGAAVPIRNENDAQMAARLQKEEHGRFSGHVVAQPVAVTNVQLQPEPRRQQPPAQQQQSNAQAVGRGLMFGARLGAAALGAAATAVADERERQRQQQQQQQHRRRP